MTAGDFGEGVKGLTEIFAQKVAAQLHLQTVDHALDAVVGTYQSIVDSEIGGNVWIKESVPPNSRVYNKPPAPVIKKIM